MDAIQFDGVGKRYWKMSDQAMLLRSLMPFRRPTRTEMWALRGIDFNVEEGDVVGMIGRNGAGKTTLLRLVAGVTKPTEGRVRVVGRVAPLISVGVGFQREMSGRENVYVNGLLLGLTKTEIDKRFDAIVDFAELEDYIDTPVKFYSSGMFMRLGFAVAVHTDPQILLVDEVLAVGDLAFQMKCLEKMQEIRGSGTTIVMVSHAMPAIRLLCRRAVVVRHGAIVFDGNPEEAIARHHELLWQEAAERAPDRRLGEQAVTGGAETVSSVLMDETGPAPTLRTGGEARLVLRVRFDRPTDSPLFRFRILGADGRVAYAVNTPLQLSHREFAAGAEVDVEFRFTCRLLGGTYRITHGISSKDSRDVLYADELGVSFYVDTKLWVQGVADLDGRVLVDGHESADARSWSLGEPDLA